MKILFYIPCHENNDCVYDTIQNIKKFTPNVEHCFCIHVNPVFHDFDYNRFSNIENVIITRFQTICYEKFESQLENIIKSYTKSKEVFGEFDYFCIFHTSQLFFKYGFEEYIKDYDFCGMSNYPIQDRFGYWIPNVLERLVQSGMFNRLFDNPLAPQNYVSMQAERLVYSKEVFDFIEKYCYTMTVPLESIAPKYVMCTEELILPTLSYYYCRKNNKKIGEWYVKTDNTIDAGMEDYFYAVKHVPRDMNHPLRVRIRQL